MASYGRSAYSLAPGPPPMVSRKGVRTSASAERTSAVSVEIGAVESKIRGRLAEKARLSPRKRSSRTEVVPGSVESRSNGQ